MWPKLRERLCRLRSLFGGRTQLDLDFEDELAFHAAMREKKKVSAGSNPTTAKVEAQRELGGIEKWKEALRDVRRPRALENLFSDVSLAVRLLGKSPAFTVVALATLTLAIGANTAVFTLLDTLLLRPLPVPESDRLTLWRIQPGEYGYSFSYPIFHELEEPSSVFSIVFAFAEHTFQMRGPEGTSTVQGAMISGQYFAALRVEPQKGRWITAMDNHPNGGQPGPVAVISDRFWKTHFNDDPHVVGKKVTLDHVVFTVAGVMPAEFAGAEVGRRPDVFVPLALEPLMNAPYSNLAAGWKSWWLRVGARLRPGVSLSQANAFLRVKSKTAFAAVIPDVDWSFNNVKRPNLYIAAEAGATGFCNARIYFRKPLIVIMILVVMVLCVACLNLASLLMARSAARERELATRFALGAGRRRLLQQLLTETLLLAAAGTAAGFAASLVCSRLLVSFLERRGDSLQFDVSPDIRVFAFATVVAVLSTVLIGIIPALRATSASLQTRIKEGSSSLRGAERRHLWPRLLMGSEIALALMLVTGAALLGYSLVLLHDSSLGFDPQNLTMLPLDMRKQQRDGAALLQFYQHYADELSKVKGLKDTSYADLTPLSDSVISMEVNAPGKSTSQVFANRIGANYFKTMGTPLLAGRDASWKDTNKAGRKAIVNEKAARLLFPHQNALGKHFYSDKKRYEVIGMVADAKYMNAREAAPPTVYFPVTQDLFPRESLIVILRTTGKPGSAIASATAILRRLAAEIPVPPALSMEQQIAESIATERLMAMLASFFAACALLITGIGLYGTLAYSTARRTGEIGIRMALGAQRGNIVRLILGGNAIIVIGGCVCGLFLSLACARFVASFLFGIHANSPAVLFGALCVLLLVGLLASLLPALRASRVDPMMAIRHE